MTEALNHVEIEPVSGLAYRVRPAQGDSTKAPCLVLLHGVGANEAGFIELARQFDPRLVVVLARGPLELGPGQFAWFRVNFSASGPAINPAQAESSRTTLLSFLEQLPQSLDIDPARIWIAGFSQGGIMSASVALTAPDKVAGFGILSGRILPEVLPRVTAERALARLQAFVSHGVDDDTLGIHFARNAKQVLDGLGVPLSYHEYVGGHGLTQTIVAEFNAWLEGQLGGVNVTLQHPTYY
jgi:phospholipase/carboxylesterase